MKKRSFKWGWMSEFSGTKINYADQTFDLSDYHKQSMENEIFNLMSVLVLVHSLIQFYIKTHFMCFV